MGKEASPEAVYCTGCGARLSPTSTFCGECGRRVSKTERPNVEPLRAIGTRAEIDLHQTADPLIGATVADRYVIESMIGRGGMGVVYRVQHAKIGKVMALKLLTGALSRNHETVQRFKREALMVSKLSHPNTVQVFDYGSSGGLTYLAMEYLNGYDLADLVERKGPQPFPQMAKIVLQACGALKEAHSYGMVHRDIKPENIFLTRTPGGEEIVKVLDFGLAKLRMAQDFGSITSTGNIVGTPYYMSPEQVRGEDVDGRGDIYSLCALLYTCITGTYVFDASTPLAVLTAQLHQEPEAPHVRAPSQEIPESASALILKGLEKNPADRYQSVDELEEALRSLLLGRTELSLHLESGAFRKEPEEETATRDEVERYERGLRRRERLARATAVALSLGAVVAAFQFYRHSTKKPEFRGREIEPNHDVTTATPVPFGSSVAGRIGQRLSQERGDQDNFLIEIPETPGAQRTAVKLGLSALPNFPTCVFIFPKGVETPQGQYCAGVYARDLEIPHLDLRPGKYLFVVRQDQNQYTEGPQLPIHENVSDDYVLSITRATPEPDYEAEPNDDESSADSLDLGEHGTIRGALKTMRDRDVVCAKGEGTAHFLITDAENGQRPLHSTLSVTPLRGPRDKIPLRVHGGRTPQETTERDQPSPWKSPPVDLAEDPCVVLELVPNPWAPRPHPVVPPASDHEWRVELVSDG